MNEKEVVGGLVSVDELLDDVRDWDVEEEEKKQETEVTKEERRGRKKGSGKGLKETDVDMRLFDETARMGLTDLPGAAVIFEKLRGLKRSSVVDRLSEMVKQGYLIVGQGYHGERVWLLDRRALNLVQLRFGRTYRKLTKVSTTNYAHRKASGDIRLWFSLEGFRTLSERDLLIKERRDKVKYARRPDFIVQTPAKQVAYVEVELSPKTAAQYRKIKLGYEQMAGRFNYVLWILRDDHEIERLRPKMFSNTVRFVFTTLDRHQNLTGGYCDQQGRPVSIG